MRVSLLGGIKHCNAANENVASTTELKMAQKSKHKAEHRSRGGRMETMGFTDGDGNLRTRVYENAV